MAKQAVAPKQAAAAPSTAAPNAAAIAATVQAAAAALPATATVTGNTQGNPQTLQPRAAVLAWLAAQPQAAAAAVAALQAGKLPLPTQGQALGVVALRTMHHAAWAACGQAVGVGNPNKPKAGAPRARALAAAAIGQAGQQGAVGVSPAQAAMPTVQRAGKGAGVQGARQAQTATA